MKASAHLTYRHYENTWDINGLLHDKDGSLGHNIGNIRLRADPSKLELYWCHSFGHFFHNLLLDIIGK